MSVFQPTRREFLGQSLAASALLLPRRASLLPHRRPRRGKFRVAAIGVGGRGAANLNELMFLDNVELVAFCDTDARKLEAAGKKYDVAARFSDFRELYAEVKELDGVMISTPDHTHAPATAMAMRRDLDVYCEKPLGHSVHEVRALMQLAAERPVVTQMGIQIHAYTNYRRVVELVQAGSLGPVREVHMLCSKAWGGGERPTEEPETPDWLDWDAWLGPAPQRAFHPTYLNGSWRRWWDFGNGTLGDMACHQLDLVHWALELQSPTEVEAVGPEPHPETAPTKTVVRYRYAARGDAPPVDVVWHDGGDRPAQAKEFGLDSWKNGVLFVGDRGWCVADYHRHQMGPESAFEGYAPPEMTVPNSIGHYAEWVEGSLGGDRPLCHFGYSGPLSEAVLLGNVSFRLGGKKLLWDAAAGAVTNVPEAAPLLARKYRDGWAL